MRAVQAKRRAGGVLPCPSAASGADRQPRGGPGREQLGPLRDRRGSGAEEGNSELGRAESQFLGFLPFSGPESEDEG